MASPQEQTRVAAGVTYTLTRRRVRNINLRVRADGSVTASAAPRVPVMVVDAFVASRADWVRSAQARAAARRDREAARQPELPTKAEALAHIQSLCRAYYPQFAATCPGGRMPKIAVRDMTTRWGSCSLKTGTLAFARRLCVAPLPAQEYVVVHEFCHFAHPNHGPGFWAAVAAVLPDYKARERLLKQM
ncbi:MAG: M48 family peptidase [Subdoligranulum sp.]|nr:M48 family peptidase [Subdoligranulum sp.]